MSVNYDLNNTGPEVQERLDQIYPNRDAISAETTTRQQRDNEIISQLEAYTDAEQSRAEGAEQDLRDAIDAEQGRAEGAEQDLRDAIDAEQGRAEGAEQDLRDAVSAEVARAQSVEQVLQENLDGIGAKIPVQATAQNQLADKEFVNAAIATSTAEFKGTYNSIEMLPSDADANDYAFVVSTDAEGNVVYNRYKYTESSGWLFEYALNNTSFTAEQWAAIQSGITSLLVEKLNALPNNSELTQIIGGKQDEIADLDAIRRGASAGATAYQKPSDGIPASDMADGVIPTIPADVSAFNNDVGYLTQHQDISGKVDWSEMVYTDVFIGAGEAAIDVMIPAYHHDTIRKGAVVPIMANADYLWIILPQTYSPTFLMEGIVIPITDMGNISVGGVTYRVLRSTNAYSATFNLIII